MIAITMNAPRSRGGDELKDPVGDLVAGVARTLETAAQAKTIVAMEMQQTEVEATSALLWLLYNEFEIALLDVFNSLDRMPAADEDYSKYRALRGGWEASLHGELVANRKSVQQVRKQVGLDFIRDRIPRETQWEVFAACGYRCVLCGAGAGVPLTVDHIVPISQGGSSRAYNLQALCGPCNSRKRDQHFGDG